MSSTPRSLSGLLPFLKPYRWPLVLAGLFLLLAAGATLASLSSKASTKEAAPKEL